MYDHETVEGVRKQLDLIRRALPCDFCALGLLEREGRTLKWPFVSGNGNERFAGIGESGSGGLSGTVMKVGRAATLRAEELAAARRLHEYPLLIAERLKSAYAVPLRSGGLVTGILLIGDRVLHVYREEERRLAEREGERLAQRLSGWRAESAEPQEPVW
ncbi:GAF domain-containing protein [Cohnella nanjingensis]|uniref:GAF domain-containing protein n=1 Tax=Cohnella nanjingensis TaxID=1387779 RepID=A0A7X0RT84_9BACL|nr:GAF domain-containing protein [Cohnella nanjingensis]MBB6671764.1 GAF domain-containing protein [Cohnella nanjingensis]